MIKSITVCKGTDCLLKKKCKRYITFEWYISSRTNEFLSQFVIVPFKNGKCEYFWKMEV